MINRVPPQKKQKSTILDGCSFIFGGLELLDEIEEMWEKLNKHHLAISPLFKEHWANCFDSEKMMIIDALRPSSVSIEHVGSTSISELCAKPIIDILIGIDSFETGFTFVTRLEAIGYEFKGENGIPFRHFFAKGKPRTHHLHIVAKDSIFWKEHLLFRDYLRKNKDERKEYADLKLELAKQYPNDREKYTDAKADFIRRIIKKAKSEEGSAEENGL